MVTKRLTAQPGRKSQLLKGKKSTFRLSQAPFLSLVTLHSLESYHIIIPLASRKDGKCSFCQVGTRPSSTKLRFCSHGRGEWYCIGSQKFLPHLPCLPQNEILIYIVIIVHTLNKKQYRISQHLFYCLKLIYFLFFILFYYLFTSAK